jgi:3-dehydroquinate synthase
MMITIRPTATLSITTKHLKQKYSCVGIKTSFEDEGASATDIIRLRKLTAENGLKLAIKIGGCEAKTDIKNAMDLCCDSIVGPMIETSYALEKYLQATRNLDVSRGINLETINSLNNIDSLLSIAGSLDYFVIGRVDLIGSMGKPRSEIESVETRRVVQDALKKIKMTNKPTYMGGALSQASLDFVFDMYSQGLLDYIETRFVIMKLNPSLFHVWDEAIRTAHEFELKWTQHLAVRSTSMTTSLNARVSLIQSRVLNSFVIGDQRVCYNIDDMKSNSLEVKASPKNYTVQFTNDPVKITEGDFVIVDSKLKYHIGDYPFFYEIDAQEKNKTINTVMNIVNSISTNPTRIVVVGGGLTQDIGAFVSTIFNRGIEWVYYPTTLLAMADSCIGGKSSLNSEHVKNKIGTFSCPNTVYINTHFLDTLDSTAMQSGYGEIVKLCAIGGVLNMYENLNITQLIKLSLIIKRAVIEIDQFDKGIRRALNYGHTVGHALEILTDYNMPHGIAVIHGMLVVNKLFGHVDPLFEKICTNIIGDTKYTYSTSDLKFLLLSDKKASNNSVTFIVPRDGKFVMEKCKVTDELCKTIKEYLVD